MGTTNCYKSESEWKKKCNQSRVLCSIEPLNLTTESTIENVNASIDADRARFASAKIESSPNDHQVNVRTDKYSTISGLKK